MEVERKKGDAGILGTFCETTAEGCTEWPENGAEWDNPKTSVVWAAVRTDSDEVSQTIYITHVSIPWMKGTQYQKWETQGRQRS